MISSNQLYEARIDFEGEGEENKEIQMLMRDYSKAATKTDDQSAMKRRASVFAVPAAIGGSSSSTNEDLSSQKKNITPGLVEQMLGIKGETRAEMRKIETLEFDIFKIRTDTNENELVTVVSYMLAKENTFSKLNMNFEVFMKFIKRIQSGYKDITYHNKTHGADLS